MHTTYLIDDYEFDRQELQSFIYDYITENKRYDVLPYEVRIIKTPALIKRKIEARAFSLAKKLGFNAICIQNFI